MSTHSLLPPPIEAGEHSDRLQHYLGKLIKDAGGWIGFDRYMETVLYAPGLGYYSAGARKFGAGGDFVTAPEISPLFSRVVAGQCAEIFAQLGDEPLVILELGAGSGAMAAEILRELDRRHCLPDRYEILEISADLRQRQRARLEQEIPGLLSRVVWLDELPNSSWVGVILANEVLDALPVKRFMRTADAWQELGVALTDGDQLTDAYRPADDQLHTALQQLQGQLPWPLPTGYVSEINPPLPVWLSGVVEKLARGLVLWIDYGYARHEYYHPERSQGTLMCHYRHHAHPDPYWWPGLQDITAWVDFTAVAEAGLSCQMELQGYTTQAHFLLAGGLEACLAQAMTGQTVEDYPLAQQVKRLVMPGEMGERFKVMALGRGVSPPSGFSLRDLRDKLWPA